MGADDRLAVQPGGAVGATATGKAVDPARPLGLGTVSRRLLASSRFQLRMEGRRSPI
jgi:hypothetical protein